MDSNQLQFVFPKAQQYAFLYENAHLLMLAWDRDNAKFLFLIQHQVEGTMTLDYPGERFTEQVMDAIDQIFFIQVTEEGSEPQKYVLGSYFRIDETAYGAYYERDVEKPNVVLFRIEGEAPSFTLEVLEEQEFVHVSKVFAEQHQDIMDIQSSHP